MPRITPSQWSSLRDQAVALGFSDLGAAPADDLARLRQQALGQAPTTGLPEWLEAGRHGEMGYLERSSVRRLDPRTFWPPARTALVGVVAHDAPGEPGDTPDASSSGADGPRGRIARYAWGRDYHLVVKSLLKALGRTLAREVPGARWRTAVDTAAVMEKPLAVLAGLGWIGKHGNLLRTQGSSWCFLGVVLTDAEIDLHEPFTADHCGTCTACMDACPTGAIVGPQQVDARRCVSYLTVELKGSVPAELREGQGSWIFGCDACQDACPWNSRRTRSGHPRLSRSGPLPSGPLLRDVLRMDEDAFTRATPKSAIKRARRLGLVRSAAVAAGNSGDDSLVPELAALLSDSSAVVRRHAAWALGRLEGRAAREALERALLDEDPAVQSEASRALA